jgi:hypothetical protein
MNRDYRSAIESRLHDSLPGLKHSPGIDWLVSTLNNLDSAGLGRARKSFLANMSDQGNLPGYLLEANYLIAC